MGAGRGRDCEYPLTGRRAHSSMVRGMHTSFVSESSILVSRWHWLLPCIALQSSLLREQAVVTRTAGTVQLCPALPFPSAYCLRAGQADSLTGLSSAVEASDCYSYLRGRGN